MCIRFRCSSICGFRLSSSAWKVVMEEIFSHLLIWGGCTHKVISARKISTQFKQKLWNYVRQSRRKDRKLKCRELIVYNFLFSLCSSTINSSSQPVYFIKRQPCQPKITIFKLGAHRNRRGWHLVRRVIGGNICWRVSTSILQFHFLPKSSSLCSDWCDFAQWLHTGPHQEKTSGRRAGQG